MVSTTKKKETSQKKEGLHPQGYQKGLHLQECQAADPEAEVAGIHHHHGRRQAAEDIHHHHPVERTSSSRT